MFKKKNQPHIKSKTIEVKSKALIGKSQMDKAIEKYTNEGWQLVKQTKVRNKDRYTLQFQYEMSDEEAAKENRSKLIRNGIVGFLIFACCGISYFQGQAAQQEREIEAATNEVITQTESVYATETATHWTATPTLTATLTATITFTPSTTPSSTITPTPQPTDTDSPSNTPRPTDLPSGTTYYVQNSANVRDCAELTCDIFATYGAGTALEIIDTNVQGDEFQGSTIWMEININGEIVYVHSALVSRTRPAPTAIPQSSTGNTSNTGVQSVAPASAGSNCSCAGDFYNCSRDDFSSMSEARSCYDKCVDEGRGDIHGLDGNDGDGNICERGLN